MTTETLGSGGSGNESSLTTRTVPGRRPTSTRRRLATSNCCAHMPPALIPAWLVLPRPKSGERPRSAVDGRRSGLMVTARAHGRRNAGAVPGRQNNQSRWCDWLSCEILIARVKSSALRSIFGLSRLGQRHGWEWLTYHPGVFLFYHWIGRREAPGVVGAMLEALPEARSFADVGAGTGPYAAVLQGEGRTVLARV